MKTKTRLYRLILVALLVAATLTACSLGDLFDPRSEYSPWGRATLTYSAAEWYAQQTAITTQSGQNGQ